MKRLQGESFADYQARQRAASAEYRAKHTPVKRKRRTSERRDLYTPDCDGRDFDNLGESPDY